MGPASESNQGGGWYPTGTASSWVCNYCSCMGISGLRGYIRAAWVYQGCVGISVVHGYICVSCLASLCPKASLLFFSHRVVGKFYGYTTHYKTIIYCNCSRSSHLWDSQFGYHSLAQTSCQLCSILIHWNQESGCWCNTVLRFIACTQAVMVDTVHLSFHAPIRLLIQL